MKKLLNIKSSKNIEATMTTTSTLCTVRNTVALNVKYNSQIRARKCRPTVITLHS